MTSEIPMPETMPELLESVKGKSYSFNQARGIRSCPCLEGDGCKLLGGKTCLYVASIFAPGSTGGSSFGTLTKFPCDKIQQHYAQ